MRPAEPSHQPPLLPKPPSHGRSCFLCDLERKSLSVTCGDRRLAGSGPHQGFVAGFGRTFGYATTTRTLTCLFLPDACVAWGSTSPPHRGLGPSEVRDMSWTGSSSSSVSLSTRAQNRDPSLLGTPGSSVVGASVSRRGAGRQPPGASSTHSPSASPPVSSSIAASYVVGLSNNMCNIQHIIVNPARMRQLSPT